MQGNILGQSAGLNIHGMIEEYVVASGGKVNAGDFVKYVNQDKTLNSPFLSSHLNSSKIAAVALDDTRAFVLYNTSENSNIYGIVCTVENDTVRLGAEVVLLNLPDTREIFLVLLDSQRVLMVHEVHSNSYMSLYGMVCTIENTVISVSSDVQLSSEPCTGTKIAAIVLENNRILIAHSGGATRSTTSGDVYLWTPNYQLYGMLCTIEGTTITVHSDTLLNTAHNSSYSISIVKLNENKILITHSYGESYQLYGMICTIEESNITVNSDVNLKNSQNGGKKVLGIFLTENKALVLHTYDNRRNHYFTWNGVSNRRNEYDNGE